MNAGNDCKILFWSWPAKEMFKQMRFLSMHILDICQNTINLFQPKGY